MGVFSGKRAFVIGGSGGIGRALSKKLARSGADLFVHGGHDSKAFDSLIQELKSAPLDKNSADMQRCENPVNIEKIVYKIENFSDLAVSPLNSILKKSDIVCVCFGPFIQKPLTETTLEDWKNAALLDYALPGYCVSTALPGMILKGWGRFLFFGGTRTYNINGYKTNAAYGGAKTGVGSLVRSVAHEYASNGITCNAVLPGFTDTEYVSEAEKLLISNKLPCKKFISADSVARGGMFLLESPEINGALLNIDFGWDGKL
ncbi:SDR family oxidoreductase [Treponema parvum]|uniref:SDR family oxidoreductase n=1 Tax=Treponema parvum TaxID=138851 RepID=A0A975F100_9SPIR|nr:SDR family oxidoreductase [Treponema parvum]QTQ12484.1 SDR family oxidoreductase [Treponema parvum]